MTTNAIGVAPVEPGAPVINFQEGDTIVTFIDHFLAGYVVEVITDDTQLYTVFVKEAGSDELGFPTIDGHLFVDQDIQDGHTSEDPVSISWQSIIRIEVF